MPNAPHNKVFVTVASVAIGAGLWIALSDSPHEVSSSQPLQSKSQTRSTPSSFTIPTVTAHTNRSEFISSPEQVIISTWDSRDYQAASDSFSLWLAENPEDALNFIATLPQHMEASHFAPEIKLHLDSLPPDEAMAKTLKLDSDHTLQISVCADSFARWLAKDEDTSLAWLTRHRDLAFTGFLAERMGRLGKFENPKASLSKILTFEDHPIRNQLVKGILLRWLREDTDTAVDFINDSEATSAFDSTLVATADQLISESPAVAKIWIEAIENEDLRSLLLAELDHTWSAAIEANYQKLKNEL